MALEACCIDPMGLKLLESLEDVLEFVSYTCYLYFELDRHILAKVLRDDYSNLIQSFTNEINTDSSLLVIFNFDLESESDERAYKIVLSCDPKCVSAESDCIGFYKCYKSLENDGSFDICSEINNPKDSAIRFILFPYLFNRDFPAVVTIAGLLNKLLIPISNIKNQMRSDIRPSASRSETIKRKLQEISDIITHSDDIVRIDFVNFELCSSLKSHVDPRTNSLENYEIKIEDKLVLDHIKSNVREWSTEIVRIIREYLSKFSEEYGDDDDISSSESSSEYDSDATSGSSSSPAENTFSMSFLTLKTSKIKHIDTMIMDDVSSYIDLICSDSIDLFEEMDFWQSYQKVVADFSQKVKSPNYMNTLSLLEYNGVSVQSIYCFDDSAKLVKEIGIDVEIINTFISALNLRALSKVYKVFDLNLIIENIFSQVKKYKHIKYVKSDRFSLVFKGILGKIINSLSRVISLELKRFKFEDNNNLLLKAVQIMYDLKNKIINLDRHFERNKVQLTLTDNNILIILDLYRDILQSFFKCNNKVISLRTDIESLISHLSDDLNTDESCTLLTYGNIHKVTVYYKEFCSMLVDLSGSYKFFVNNLISQYTKLSENISNILNLDELLVITKSEICKHEELLIVRLKSYIDILSMFEALSVLKLLNSLSISKNKNLFVNKVDRYIEDILEEYDRIIGYQKNSHDHIFCFPVNGYSNDIFSRAIVKEKILNLMDIIETIKTHTTKSILKNTHDNLNKLLEDGLSETGEPMNPDSLNMELQVTRAEGLYLLTLNSEAEYEKEIINYSWLTHSNNSLMFSDSIFCMYLVDTLVKFTNYLDGEKRKQIDSSVFETSAFLTTFNHLTTNIMKSMAGVSTYLIHKGVLNKDLPGFIKALYDYCNIVSLILGLYRRVNYLLTSNNFLEKEGTDEAVEFLFYTKGVINYIKLYTDIEVNPGHLSRIFISTLKNRINRINEQFVNDDILKNKTEEYYEVTLYKNDEGLKTQPPISQIRKEYYSRARAMVDSCNELINNFDSQGFNLYKDIDLNHYLCEHIRLIENTLFNVNKEYKRWSSLLSDRTIDLISSKFNKHDHIDAIKQTNQLLLECNNINERKVIGFILILLPKKEYIVMVKQIKVKTLRIIEKDVLSMSIELLKDILTHCKKLGIQISRSILKSNVSRSEHPNSDSLLSVLETDLSTIKGYILLLENNSRDEIYLGHLSLDPLQFFDYYISISFDYIESITDVALHMDSWKENVNYIQSVENELKLSNHTLSSGWIHSSSIKKLLDRMGELKSMFIKERADTRFLDIFKEIYASYSKMNSKLHETWTVLKGIMFDIEENSDRVIDEITNIENDYKTINGSMVKIQTNINKLKSIEQDGFDAAVTNVDDNLFDEIESYKKRFLEFMKPLKYYKNLCKLEIFAPINTIFDHITKIKDLDDVIENPELQINLDILETLYTHHLHSLKNDSYWTKKLIEMIIKSTADENKDHVVTVSMLLFAYKNKRDEFENYFSNEKNIQKIVSYFKELQEQWDGFEVEFSEDTIEFYLKDGSIKINTFQISNKDEVFKFLNDNEIKLRVGVSSHYSDSISEDGKKWLSEIKETTKFFNDLTLFCKKFGKLLRILSSNFLNFKDMVDTMCKLSNNLKGIKSLTKLNLIKNKNVPLISEMIEEIEDIELQLNTFLNNVRFKCPRLYFIHDSDLIEIIAGENIDYYLGKIFPGLVNIIENDKFVSGIVSSDGDILEFSVSFKHDRNDEIKLINDIDLAIQDTLRKSFIQLMNSLWPTYSKFEIDEKSMDSFINKYTCQTLVLSMSVCWTRIIEKSESFSAIKNLTGMLTQILEFVISKINSSDKVTHSKAYQLFLIVNYQLSKTRELEIESMSKLKLLKCIRYYWNGNDVHLNIMTKQYTYSFEYIPNNQKMIITDVTERFYSFASMALNSHLMPCARGPAGTGKTETIKSLSYLTGTNMLVFNLSESYEVDDIQKILSGICMLGYWGIFDEFNRLTECVLSSVTEKIQKICNKNEDNIFLLNKKIVLKPNTACFITMNPGYSGRSELPLNCVHMCQPFVMEDVNLASIVFVNLRLNRFEEPLELAHEVIFVLDSLKTMFRSIEYDFGLRFVNQVFNFINFFYNNDSDSGVDICYRNESLFFKSLYRVLYPRMSKGEMNVFKSLKLVDCDFVDSKAECYFVDLLNKSGLDAISSVKAMQIYQMTKISVSIILFGHCNTGKSSAFNDFFKCINKEKNYDIIIFDPNSLTISQLYGYEVEDRWYQGLIPQLLKSDFDTELFIVFDGEIKQSWVENLNSLLDDNRVLTIANGERIHLKDGIKLFFETDSLSKITPATISRSAIVKFERSSNNDVFNEMNKPYDYLDKEKSLYSMIAESRSFILKCSNDNDDNSHFKEVENDCEIYTLYLSKGLESIDFINFLVSIFNLNYDTNTIKPKIKSNALILLRDIDVLKNRRQSSSLYAILRQIIKFGFFFNYDIKRYKWVRIYIQDIAFSFVQREPNDTDCRLLSMLPIIHLVNKDKYDKKLESLNEKINKIYGKNISNHDLKLIESLRMCTYGGWFILKILEKSLNDNSPNLTQIVKEFFVIEINLNIEGYHFLESRCILESLKFIYLALLYNKTYLCITGPPVSGKRFLSTIVSMNLGFKLIDFNDITQCELTTYIINSGVNGDKYLVYIDLDLVLSTKPNMYYIAKNMIFKEFEVVMNADAMGELVNRRTNNSTIEQFKTDFKNNLKENMRFIITGNQIESSLLNQGITCNIERLSNDELESMSNNFISNDRYKNIIVEMYHVCEGYTGYSFMDFIFMIKMYNNWYELSTNKSNKILKHLDLGIKKIELFKNEVNKLEESLHTTRDKLNFKNIESEKKIKLLVDKQLECEEKRKIAMTMTESLNKKKNKLEGKMETINKKIENATPMIERAKNEVENINKRSLEELKTMHNPPGIIKYVIETVSVALQNNKKIHWEEARRILKSSDFINKIISYDVENMSDQMHNELKQRLASSQWDKEKISKASKAAGPLAKWVISIVECYDIYRQVIPLRKEVEEIEQENLHNEEILRGQIQLISDLEVEIKKYRNDYGKSEKESTAIVNDIEITERKLALAKRIIDDLTNELERWNDKVVNIKSDLQYVVTNSVIKGLIPTFVSLDHDKRGTFLERCEYILMNRFGGHSLELKKIINIESYAIKRNDKFKHVIILDCDKSDYSTLIESSVTQASACDDNFLQVLDVVKGFSGKLVVTDLHCCSIDVKNFILNEFKSKLESESGFNMYIISTAEYFEKPDDNEKDIIYSIYNRALVLNMKMNPESFKNFAMNKVVEVLNPDLHTGYINMNKNVKRLHNDMKDNETMLLERLIDSDVFEPNFIEFIDTYKHRIFELDRELEELKITEDGYHNFVDSRNELILLLCDLRNQIDELGTINKLYKFDINILFYFAKAMENSESILSEIIILTHNWIEMGIFKIDKMFWRLKILNVLSRYNSKLKEDMENLNSDYNTELQQRVNHLTNIYLKADRFDPIITDYYNTIVLITDGFEDPVNTSREICIRLNKKLDTFAVGSISEINTVKYSIIQSLNQGNSALLKNVDLSKTWLNKIETEFLNLYKETKLFLTCGQNVELSNSMSLSCHKITCEISDFKFLLIHLFNTFKTVLESISGFGYILLKCIFVYSVIFSRQLYIPFGLSSNHGFNINDLKMSIDVSAEFYKIQCESGFPVKTEEVNSLISEIYSAKISNPIDLKVLRDVINFSDIKVMKDDSLDFENWLDQNCTEDDLTIIGFTKHTQSQLFNRKMENESCVRYDTREIKLDNYATCACNIIQRFVLEEVEELRSREDALINPESHRMTCNSINSIIEGECRVKLNLNNLLSANRLIQLIKFPVAERNNIKPSEIELFVDIDETPDQEGADSQLNGHSFVMKATLYNGVYSRESNSITPGGGGEVHNLICSWKRRLQSKIKESITYIPLHSFNGELIYEIPLKIDKAELLHYFNVKLVCED